MNYSKRKERILGILEKHKNTKKIIILHNDREVEKYLDTLVH
jgi:hypothetical protein